VTLTNATSSEITQLYSVNTYMYINWEVSFTPVLGVMTKLLLQRAVAVFFRNLDGPQANICACLRWSAGKHLCMPENCLNEMQ
jgi:hypothetical protein